MMFVQNDSQLCEKRIRAGREKLEDLWIVQVRVGEGEGFRGVAMRMRRSVNEDWGGGANWTQ